MKYSVKSLTILLLLLLLPVSNAKGDDQKLKLEIGLSKKIYLLSEPIWLDATLANTSKDTVRIFGFFPPCMSRFHIEVIDSLGNILPYTGPKYDMIPGKGWIISPEETYYDCFDLLDLFSKIENLLNIYFLKLIPPGKYTVRARYEKIYSEKIEFEVVEPMGKEKETYQLLKDAYTYLLQKKSDLQKQKLQELVNRFPKSVYVEKASKELLGREEFLEKFPNSGFNQTALRVLTERMVKEKQEEKKQEFLQRIIKNHPKTRSAKFAEKILRGW